MQPQEGQLITDLFERLRPFDSQSRDPEAERLIANFVSRQPSTAYLLTQTVLVQEQALKAAQDRIAELEAQTGSGQQQSTSFLGSAPRIGPWGSAPAAAASPPPARSPWGAPAGAPTQPAAGGGFLRTALTTAAGVAGGALLFEGIRGLLSNGSSPFAAAAAAPLLPPDSLPSEQPTSDQSSSDQFSSTDVAQDDSSADDYDAGSSDDSGFGSDDV
jgi:hypothetical protein